MEAPAIDFVPWGLDATWPSRCWAELIHGRRDEPPRGIRLGHASDKAFVLACTFPRERFDATVGSSGADPVRELAYETTFAMVNLVLHQIRVPGARPDGLVGSLMQFASQQADRHRNWTLSHWGGETASVTGMAGWQSGFSVTCPDAYVIAHAYGVQIERLRLTPVRDLSGYNFSSDPLEVGAMHWELWRSESAVGYGDLARVHMS